VEGEQDASERRVDASLSVDRFGVITARDLFHRRVVESETPTPAPVVESALEVELLGTLVTGSEAGGTDVADASADPGDAKNQTRPRSVALVRDVDGKVRTLATGDLFADERAKLVEIERGRIVLEQSGRLETVTLAESAAAAAKSGSARPGYTSPRDPVAVAAAAKDAEVARLQREVQRRMREAMPQVGAAQPTTGRN
jgi:hypothetical protein